MRSPSLYVCLSAVFGSLLTAGCEGATDPRPSAKPSASFNHGLFVRARINAEGGVVLLLGNYTTVARTISFGGCDVSLLLFDRATGDVKLDTRAQGCVDIGYTVSMPAGATVPHVVREVPLKAIQSAVAEESDREFFVYVRVADESPVWLEAPQELEPRWLARSVIVAHGVEVRARIDRTTGAMVFTLSNPTSTARTLEFYGCSIAIVLFDRSNGSLRLDTRDHACRAMSNPVAVPARTSIEQSWNEVRAADIEAAVPDAASREFYFYVSFGAMERAWLK